MFLVTIPAKGGTIVEGVIGAPHVINPVLATTETDKDLVRLIFSGLLKPAPDGTYVPDLAKSYTVSPDGLVYTFTLRENLKWSDGKPITSSDIGFTMSKLVDSSLSSHPFWQSLTVSLPDANTVVYTLTEPRQDMLEHAAIGILPQHIWGDMDNETFANTSRNLRPVGSGPYKYSSMHDTNSVVTEITLKKNSHAVSSSYIDTYVLRFFANQTDLLSAIHKGTIDLTLAADSTTAAQVTAKNFILDKIETPETIAVFQLRNVLFFSGSFEHIVDQAIDKNVILDTVQNGYGILPSVSLSAPSHDDTISKLEALGYVYSNEVLRKNGTAVSFPVAVENNPILLQAARELSDQLATIGITMTIKAFDPGMFKDIVRSNQYQFFMGNTRTIPDGYAPLFTLYAQAIPFIHKKSAHISIPEYLDSPDFRYLQLDDWHIRTNKVWRPFAKKYNSNNN